MIGAEVPVLALSADHIVRLTGLTMRQLAYWDRTGFFEPEYASEDRRSPNSRIYSFRDAIGLRTISTLMNKYNVSHKRLKEFARALIGVTDRPWSELKLRVVKGRVHFDDPHTNRPVDPVDGQYALVEIIDEIKHVRQGVEQLKARQQDQIGRFERHRYVSHNKLVIAGTRVAVATILEYIAAGYATETILQEFPTLTAADVDAVATHGATALAA